MNVPLKLLQNWRLPDRDLHRILALYGPLSTSEIRRRTRLAHYVVDNALRRMSRQGVAVGRRVRIGKSDHNFWTAA